MKKKAAVIGAGIGGLASACILAKEGWDVKVFDNNRKAGGRCNIMEAQGFVYDMGPSWYLMPDIFEKFFALLNERVDDHLGLVKLSPSYRVFFKGGRQADFYSDLARDAQTADSLEPGAGQRLREYLKMAAYQYNIAMGKFVWRNYDSPLDFFNWRMLSQGVKLSVFSRMQDYVGRFFKSPEMQKVAQYTLVFLGSSPYNTPAFYNIMSHVDLDMGVFYPQGGLYKIVEALEKIAARSGAQFHYNSAVSRILTYGSLADGIELAAGDKVPADVVISNADIYHTETDLIKEQRLRSYSRRYWRTRVVAPSGLVLYLGVKDKIPSLAHHNLLFSADWGKNFSDIFDEPRWPRDPSFYVCCPSKTDPAVAPRGKENLFVFVPIPAGLEYGPGELSAYTDRILHMMEKEMNIPSLRSRLQVKHHFCVKDFISRYHSFRGSALGLAHTLGQTAMFRPANRSRKIRNLFYAGGNTLPGIGVPMCLISADLACRRILSGTYRSMAQP